MKIPFSPPDLTDAEIEEVASAIKSGWITTGPKTKELEREVAALCHTNKAVCLSSQTSCAEMALRLLGIGEGDEVIVPAYTYTASAEIVCHVGARLIFIDSQPDSLEMDYDAVEKAITDKTKVIIPVDIGGVPCDYDRIFSIVEKKKELFTPSNDIQSKFGRIIVCADTAHAFGSTWHGKPIGSVADFSAFSFHAVKNFTTAEGGALTWKPREDLNDEEIYNQVQLYSLHGQSKDALSKNQLGAWEYDILGPWYKCNMTDIHAAIGLAQMERYPALLKRRREIIEKYDRAFKPLGVHTLPHFTDEHISSGHLYLTRIFKKNGEPVSDGERREIIIKLAERGITTNVHYKPLPMMTGYKKLGFDIKDYPNAYAHYANEISLPLFSRLTDEEVDYIIDNYTDVIKEYI
ncbi:MAG: DegT/DnrJ/EryC1/StrS family aminotransferase [Acutalibacteraceae bacterium]|nr:DegT/DnrJ/EryC1/StrS family aminotransferase [Oscillospiraceae bacterium]MEE0444197.1 DegT/DnrJ/EryC1/StrS family aminotransferase [Acutalibacteraceae bacterium]